MADNLTQAEVLDLLRQHPHRLTELCGNLSSSQLHDALSPGEWSINYNLAHLRSCSDVWGDCIAVILKEDHPTIKAINPTTWIKKTNYYTLQFRESLQAFCQQRAALLAILEVLPPASWLRGATVTGAGRPLEYTVFNYARRLALHERVHVNHIARMVNPK